MQKLCKEIVKKLRENNKTISFMESCTGGFLANEITNISGASEVLKVSLVTYSDEFKIKFNVDKKIIDEYSVYSIETAESMARNIANFSHCNIAVGVTGELGNTSNTENRVYYSIYSADEDKCINKEIIVELEERKDMKYKVAQNIFENILGGIEWKTKN